jgi:hypothetical protein
MPIDSWYEFILQQAAAESYLDGLNLQADITAALQRGNNQLGFPERGSVRLTAAGSFCLFAPAKFRAYIVAIPWVPAFVLTGFLASSHIDQRCRRVGVGRCDGEPPSKSGTKPHRP